MSPRPTGILDEAGWVRKAADGFRAKDGKKLSRRLSTPSPARPGQKLTETVQGDLRKIGVDLQASSSSTPPIAWGKLATQEFDLFGMSFPYITAGDALNLYFPSTNIPTPNRMNWRNPDTDERLLQAGITALSDADRAAAYGQVLQQVHEAAVWMPLYHEPMKIAVVQPPRPVPGAQQLRLGLLQGPRSALRALIPGSRPGALPARPAVSFQARTRCHAGHPDQECCLGRRL
jgi:peptide/nickel transport system substrate-binding protein